LSLNLYNKFVSKDGEYLSWVECRKQQRNWVTGKKKFTNL